MGRNFDCVPLTELIPHFPFEDFPVCRAGLDFCAVGNAISGRKENTDLITSHTG